MRKSTVGANSKPKDDLVQRNEELNIRSSSGNLP